MLCIYYRWKISNAADDNTPLSQSVTAHVCRCAACRHYYRQVMALDEQLGQQSQTWRSSNPVPSPVEMSAEAATSWISQKRWGVRIAAAVLLIAGLWIILHDNLPGSRRELMNQYRPWLSYVPISEQTMPSVVPAMMTDYYQRELSTLAKDTHSAAEFAASCVGVKLDRVILATAAQP
jgi:predicted anti-sigma-YlaC factor YlaD